MATASARPPTPPSGARPPLRRDTGRRVIAGVCAGLAARWRVDPLLVRLGFVAAALAGGIGIALYVLAWMTIPRADRGAEVPAQPGRGSRGTVEVALGAALLLLSVLLAFRELGVWFSDAVVWPLVLVAAGAALLWRQSGGGDTAQPTREEPAWAASFPAPAPTASPPAAAPTAPAATPRTALRPVTADTVRERAKLVSRTSLGVALVIAAGLAFLQATGSLDAARDALTAVLVVVIVLGVIFAPWVMRMGRSLTAERAERIRSQERAEMAAHLHDSVLQTLAMVQRRADNPREVSSLARRQERELRTWLSDKATATPTPQRLAAALEEAAQEVENAHGTPVEVVTVGDAALDARAEALVAAAREAMVNAAKFGDGSPVAVFAEASDGRAQVFVRDRGPGFDPDRIPADRRGVRESIVGRMERHGGRARVTSSADAGTEVELTLERGYVVTGAPRVVIVDDHELFRSGVRAELEELVEIVGDAATVDGAVEQIAASAPDVVLLDVHMPDGGGVEVIRRAAPEQPDVRFLALSVSDAAEDVIAVIRAGARGYVTKTISPSDLADAIRRVHEGDAVFSPRLAGFVLDAFAGGAPASAAPAEGAVRSSTPSSTSSPRASARCSSTSPAATCTRRSACGSRSRPRPSRRTCRRCCASCSSRAGTSCRAGPWNGGSSTADRAAHRGYGDPHRP